MGKRISFTIFLFGLISIFAFSTAFAEEMEYKEYKILKGDTLWDISSKEIKNPFLWPKIWKENPEIKNPDRIYPNQTIKIPLKLLEKEQPVAAEEKEIPAVKEEAKKEEAPKAVERKIEPTEKRYLADKDLLIASGYITDYIGPVKSVGAITGAPTGRTMFGFDDYVYIKTNNSANAGDKFYIIRQHEMIKHPKTKAKLGYYIEVPGILEVVGTEDGQTKAKIIRSYTEVHTGDLLDTFSDVEPVIGEDNPRKPDINGYVVAVQQLKSVVAYYDILFIDKGSSSGLEVGDALQIVSKDPDYKSRWTGAIQIISLKDSTSAAIVKKSEDVIKVGDTVTGLK